MNATLFGTLGRASLAGVLVAFGCFMMMPIEAKDSVSRFLPSFYTGAIAVAVYLKGFTRGVDHERSKH